MGDRICSYCKHWVEDINPTVSPDGTCTRIPEEFIKIEIDLITAEGDENIVSTNHDFGCNLFKRL